MEILEAYDLVGSFAGAASLMGCSHHTVERHVQARAAGRPLATRKTRPRLTGPYEPKIMEWVERSSGKIRGDKIHEKLVAMGYPGSPRTTSYAVRRAKTQYKAHTVRVHKPWVAEPGGWLQYDFGDGPRIDGKKTVLFLAWLAWSRYRAVIPLRDRSMPSVLGALDSLFRVIGGVPTYVLSDNERTLTSGHVAGLPVRNSQIIDFGHYYGATFHSCVPFDPATKGGVERSVALAKADLVPMDTNLVEEYASFGELEMACEAFTHVINEKVHSVTRRAPVEMLAEERALLHPVPLHPYTATLGVARKVPANTPMVTFEHAQYSVPYELMGETVWARRQTSRQEEVVVIAHVTPQGPVEVARHPLGAPGQPSMLDAHFPPEPDTVLHRRIRPVTQTESSFVQLGDGARAWLHAATGQGVNRIKFKMEHALTLAKASTPEAVDRVLALAASFQRFHIEDMNSILTTLRSEAPAAGTKGTIEPGQSLAQGTNPWTGFGVTSAHQANAALAVVAAVQVTGAAA